MKHIRIKPHAYVILLVVSVLVLSSSTTAEYTVGKLTECKVLSITDGNTIVVDIAGVKTNVRLIVVNAPELGSDGKEPEYYATEAMSYVTKLLPVGTTVYLELDVAQYDQYNRLLAYVWLKDVTGKVTTDTIKTNMLNGILVANGYAQVMTVPPNVKYADVFVALERTAKESNLGLWNKPQTSTNADLSSSDVIVYVTKTGEKYHYEWCRTIERSKVRIPMSISEAKAKGYEPCSVCNPPK